MEFSLEELEAEQKRRAMEASKSPAEDFSAKEATRAFAYGAAKAGVDISTLPFLPSDIVQSIMGTDKTAGQKVREALKQPQETDFPGYERYFRAGEGAAPGFVTGAAGGSIAGPGGAAVGGTIGAIGGALANVAGKELFPTSPTGQMLTQLAAPGGLVAVRGRAATVPGIKTPSVDVETGIPLTGGQRTGNVEQLLKEQEVGGSIRGGQIASAFDAAQAASVDDFFSNLQKFSANPKLSAEQVSQGIYKAFQEFTQKEYNIFKAANKNSFDKAAKAAGNEKVIPSTATTARIDELISQYNKLDPNTVPDAPRIVAGLEQLKARFAGGTVKTPLMTVEKTPSGFSVGEFQKIAEDFGAQAYGKSKAPGTGSAVFAGVAPGTTSGITKYILGGMREDLGTAAQSGVKGAAELDAARKGFAAGLDKLEEVAVKPLVKYFNKPNASALVPEDVVKKMAELKPSQQAELAAVIKDVRPDIYETIRANGLKAILDKARTGEAAALGQPKFDIGVALKQLGSLDDAQIQWLFPTKEEKNLFKAGMRNLQQIQQKAPFKDPDQARVREALRAMQEGAGAFAGAKGKYGVQFLTDAIRSIVGTADEKKLAAFMFTPDGRSFLREMSKESPNLSKVQKYIQNAPEQFVTGMAASAVTAREVPTASQRIVPQQNEVPSLDELRAEAARRGLKVE